MKIEGNIIIFKSNPDNFYKEREGLKPYTIRRITMWSEMKEFEEFYKDYKIVSSVLKTAESLGFETSNHKIKIINSTTHESFTRTISDISEFEGLWIISWKLE